MKQTKRQRKAKVPALPQVTPRKKGKLPWRTFKKQFHVKMGAEMPWPIFASKRSADKL